MGQPQFRAMASRLQKFILGLMPKSWAASAEADSRRWMLSCPACGAQASVWDLGGVRWKASSRVKLTLMECRACKKTGMHSMKYVPEDASKSRGGP